MKNYFMYVMAIVVLGFSSCASKKNNKGEDSQVSIQDIEWRLVELKGNAVDEKINGKTPFLQFHSQDNRYSANGGCNGIGGTYTISEGNVVAFSQGFSTKMACPNMEIENGIFQLLQAAKSFDLAGSNLALKDAQGTTLAKFVK